MTPTPNSELTRSNPEMPLIVDSPQSEFDLREYLDVLWRRKVVFLVVFFTIMILAAAYTLTRPKIFEATTKVVVAAKAPSASSGDSTLDLITSLTENQTVDTAVEIINSDQLIRAAFLGSTKKSDGTAVAEGFTPEEQKRGFGIDPKAPLIMPGWSFTVAAAKDTSVIDITARAYRPKLAARFADAIALTYIQQDLQNSNAPTRDAREFVEKQLTLEKERLEGATARLADFQHISKLVTPDVQIAKAAEELADLRTAAEAAQATQSADALRESNLKAQVDRIDPKILAGQTYTDNPAFAHARDQLAKLNDQLAGVAQEYTSESPQYRAIDAQIKQYEKQLQTLPKTLVSSTLEQRNPLLEQALGDYYKAIVDHIVDDSKLAYSKRVLADREAKFNQLPSQQREYAELKRQVDESSHIVSTLTDKKFDLQIAEQSPIPSGIIAAAAEVPLVPSYPKVVLNMAAAFLMAIMLGVASVLLTERLDTRVHDPSVATRIAGMTLLAAVPETKPTKDGGEIIIGRVESNHAFLEAFRLLRNNIAFSAPDKVLKTIAVTSASKSEGKTTVSVNLAVAMAMDGKRVLIIDADLRRPSVHSALGLPRESGFTTVVKGITKLDDAITTTPFENLYALTSGPLPPNPTEFLNSQHARRVFAEAAEKFDVVVIDSPPSSGLSDFQVISTVADGAVLVIALDSTNKQQLQAALRMLRQANAPLLGTVLNRAKYHRGAYGYYSSYYYAYYSYSYYGEEGETTKRKGRRKKRRSPSKPETTTKV
jgi:succinoglycan biosynthesis transport protein ExoP